MENNSATNERDWRIVSDAELLEWKEIPEHNMQKARLQFSLRISRAENAQLKAQIELVKALREEMRIIVEELAMPYVSPGYVRNKIDEALAHGK